MTLYRIALLTMLLHLAFAGARVTLSLFALHLGASAATVGMLVVAARGRADALRGEWGRYIDRVGVRGPMYRGRSRRCSRRSLLAFAVPRLEALFVVSALAGCGFSIFHIAVHQAGGPHRQTGGARAQLQRARARVLDVERPRADARRLLRSTGSAIAIRSCCSSARSS